MKKSDKIILTVYVIFGIILLAIGIVLKIDYYSPMISAMGVGLSFSGIMQFIRLYRNTKPENIEAYREKLRQQAIDLKDERKIQLRNRAVYIT